MPDITPPEKADVQSAGSAPKSSDAGTTAPVAPSFLKRYGLWIAFAVIAATTVGLLLTRHVP